MSDDEAPKSAIELAMARLKKKDEDAGVTTRVVTDELREAIAEVRRVYEAKLAEREILHQGALRRAPDPDSRAALDDEHRRDRERTLGERDRKIEALREGQK
jgi:hypothetical protein